MPPSLKQATGHTLKWNAVEKFASQALYAVTGIVLANVLPKADFGLVGVILIFQAFGILFVDSGFGAALLQKKEPTERDYSTVFWFNLMVSVFVYAIMWMCAPLIARFFHGQEILIPLTRVMLLSLILNALSIVQTNRLMKAMNVKQVALASLIGLTLSGGLGIWLALKGAGAWALVWQTVSLAGVRSLWLWITVRWRPRLIFSIESLKSIYRVGLGVFTSSLLNTIFLQIYSFVIGAWGSMVALGVYTQADKWSKMGSASLSQIVMATFVPLLSKFQDNAEAFRDVMRRVSRLCSFITLPFMCGLTLMAAPIFHTLFGQKWDEAIPLFQILMVRGILLVFIQLLTNALMALGHAKSLVIVETVKDTAILVAIALTLPMGSVEALVWGQLAASLGTFIYVLIRVARATGLTPRRLAAPLWKYLPLLVLPLLLMGGCLTLHLAAPALLGLQAAVGLGSYCLLLSLNRDPLWAETKNYVFARFHRKKSTC